MKPLAILATLVLLWGVSALLSGWLAARKARSARRWALLGAVVGPLALLIHVFYPPRHVPDTVPCPRCGKPVSRRAVACHHCQHRFPAVDVLITRMPEDPSARRTITDEVAREYGITYEEASRKVASLPMAGYRHIAPDQAGDFVQRLTQAGAETSVVPAGERSASR
jgi:hypothetical protein